MWHKPCRTFHPWCPCIKTRCLCCLVIPPQELSWVYRANFPILRRRQMTVMTSRIYWPIECLFNSLFRLTTKKHQRFALLFFCEGSPPVDSPHKGTVTRKMFPFGDVIMWSYLPKGKCRYFDGILVTGCDRCQNDDISVTVFAISRFTVIIAKHCFPVASFTYTRFLLSIREWISNYYPGFMCIWLLIHALSSMLIGSKKCTYININSTYRQIKSFICIQTYMYHLAAARETTSSLSELAAFRLVSTWLGHKLMI